MRILLICIVILLALLSVWAFKLKGVSDSVAKNAIYWNDRSQEPGELLYVALGDSAAQSIGASQPAKGYVGLLAADLKRKTGKSVRVVNLSESGARTGDVIKKQLPELAALEPDFVTLAIGGNDIKDFNRVTFEANMTTILDALPSGSYVADTPFFGHGRWEADALTAAIIIREGAADRGLPLAPLHEFGERSGWRGMFRNFAADWFHPNDRGYELWADAFLKVIKIPAETQR